MILRNVTLISVLFLLFLGCNTMDAEEDKGPVVSVEQWYDSAQWCVSTWTKSWGEKLSITALDAPSPAPSYVGTAEAQVAIIAFDMPAFDTPVGLFDSLRVTYRASHDQTITLAKIKAGASATTGYETTGALLAAAETSASVTFTPADFSRTWGFEPLESCNEISFSNKQSYKTGDAVSVFFEKIELFYTNE